MDTFLHFVLDSDSNKSTCMIILIFHKDGSITEYKFNKNFGKCK